MLQHEELLRSSLVNSDLQWLSYLSSTSESTLKLMLRFSHALKW